MKSVVLFVLLGTIVHFVFSQTYESTLIEGMPIPITGNILSGDNSM